VNENEKRLPAEDSRNPKWCCHCTPAAGRIERDCGYECRPTVVSLAGYEPIVAGDVREAASHYGRWHRWNELAWNDRAESHHLAFVTGPLPCR
jgi:hypothetical protein